MKPVIPSILLLLAAIPLPAATPVAVIEEKFRAFDANSDGVISGAELEAAPYLPKLDLDRNGSLTLAEAKEALNGKAAAPTPAPSGNGLFQQLDKNSDGKLTSDELPRKQWFTALDLDKSGDITFEEAQTAFARLRRGGEILPSAGAVKPASEDPALKEAPLVLKGSEHGIGRLIPDLSLKDLDGQQTTLSAALSDRRGAIIAFIGATCPISGKFGPELARLEKDAARQNLCFLLVCPTAAESADDLRKFAAAHGLQSPVIHDQDSRITAALAATTTTEVFLIDAKRTLVYRGAINDQYGLGYAKSEPTRTYLRDAAAAMLAGELPEIAATTAPGCAIDLSKPVTTAASPVTYHNQISRILQANCIECHRSDGLGPFSLESYDDVIKNAAMIRKQVERGVMPPWFAAPVPGQNHTPWLNDTSLSAQDRSDLLSWLASDRPKGDPADAPLPLKFPKDWALGEPDAVVQLPSPIAIKAEGTMPYQFVTVATDFPEDRWVQAYEILPTNRAVVHHVIVQVHEKGENVRDRGEGAGGYWAAYVPGNASHTYPAGFAKKIPAGATVSFQIHYTPSGKRGEDQLKMGLHFAKAPPRYVVHTAAVAQTRLNIPAGAADHVETAERTLPTDMNLTAYMAHMHVRGKAFKFEATFPDGRQEVLLDIPRYDFNWQLRYDYALPRFLPKGTKVKITAIYDNSEANPANPDPTKTVRWGQQTYDEMMIGYFEYYTPLAGDIAGR